MTNKISTQQPKIGVGVLVIRNDTVLLGKRKNAHGADTWSFPGGHLEWFESVFDCAHREVLEETGLQITNLQQGPYTNDIFESEGKHYLTVFVIAHAQNGEPQVMEPTKCEEWRWYRWDELPKPLFLPIVHLLEQGYSPFS